MSSPTKETGAAKEDAELQSPTTRPAKSASRVERKQKKRGDAKPDKAGSAPANGGPKKEKGAAAGRQRQTVEGCDPVIEPAAEPTPDPSAEAVTVVVVGDAKVCAAPGLLATYVAGRPKKSVKSFKTTTISLRPDPEVPIRVVNATLSHESLPRATQLVTADAVIVCYTPYKPETLEEARTTWLPLIRKVAPTAVVCLCASKIDVLAKAAEYGLTIVRVADACREAAEMKLDNYFEVSAKHNKGVKALIESTVLMACNSKKGNPPVVFSVGETDVRYMKAVRNEVMVPPKKPDWIQVYDDVKLTARYFNRKTRETKKGKPPDFDGIDYEQRAIDEVENLKKVYLRHSEKAEEDAARLHGEKIAKLQKRALDASVVATRFEAQLLQLRSDERRYKADREKWQAELKRVQDATEKERNARAEEELAAGEETSEKKILEESCKDTERKLIDEQVPVDPTQMKQKQEVNAALRASLAAMKNETTDTAQRLKQLESTIAHGQARNAKIKQQIAQAKAAHDAASEEVRELSGAITGRHDRKIEYQNALVREKERMSLVTLEEEHKEQQEAVLAKSIDALEFDIMRHFSADGSPPAEASLAHIGQYAESKSQLVDDLARKCASGLVITSEVAAIRNAFMRRLQELIDTYEANEALLKEAVGLPRRVASRFSRKAAWLESRAGGIHLRLKEIEQLRRTLRDRSEMDPGCELYYATPLIEQSMAAAPAEQLEAEAAKLKKKRGQLYSLARRLRNRAGVCLMEEAYVGRLQETRAADRVAHTEFARQLVSTVDNTVSSASAERAPVSPLSVLSTPWPVARSVALNCSAGLLSETRRNLLDTETMLFVRKLDRRSAARAEHERCKKLIAHCVAPRRRGAAASPAEPPPPSSGRIRQFAFATATLADAARTGSGSSGGGGQAPASPKRALASVTVLRSASVASAQYRDTAAMSRVSIDKVSGDVFR
ncbi:hypothetical protein DIPPA_22072 [Diplonema papillatum]|nr:hypothetical protein DIPPA_22072 [Diplonema papillatum]